MKRRKLIEFVTPLDSADYTAKPDVHLVEGNYWREQIQVGEIENKSLDSYSSLISTNRANFRNSLVDF